MALFNKKEKKEKDEEEGERGVSKKGKALVKEPEPPKAVKKKKRSLPKMLMIGLPLLCVLGGAAFFTYYFFFNPRVYHERQLERVKIAPQVIEFAFHRMVDLYNILVETNDKEVLIIKEMERLLKISEEFPSQKPIVVAESALLETALQSVKMLREELEKKIEMIYVSFNVNQEKGLNLIENNKDPLVERARQTLSTYEPLFERLNKERDNQGFLTRFIHRF